MLGMDGQNRYHCATNLMNYTASEMHRILCKLAVYDGVAILYLHVSDTEHRQKRLQNCPAHFHSGMAGFRVYAACVRHAYRKIHVSHNLGEDYIGNVGDFYFRACFSVGEYDPLKGGRFDVRRGEPIGESIDLGYDIFLIIDLLKSVFHVCYPAAAL